MSIQPHPFPTKRMSARGAKTARIVHSFAPMRPFRSLGYRFAIAIVATGLCLLGGLRMAMPYIDAAALLTRVEEAGAKEGLGAWRALSIEERDIEYRSQGHSVRARRYLPQGVERAPGVVLLHGIHRLGLEEPRLVAFARALAASGISVLTPELRELADYRIDAASIPAIGEAARLLADDRDVLPGGIALMGFSFAGGLGLLTAADPAYAPYVKAVLAVGAHGDLERVARFFATNEAVGPDGRASKLRAHDYGALVLVYGHTEAFFADDDAGHAKEALRLWLWQEWDAARERAALLSPKGRALLEELFEGKLASVSESLLAFAEHHAPSIRAASPAGKLESIRAKVFLLHGAGDDVVPATETLWLERELPEAVREEVLLSAAVQHVEPGKSATMLDRARLVHFVARLLATLQAS